MGFIVALGVAVTALAILRQLLHIRPEAYQHDFVWVLFSAMALAVAVTLTMIVYRRARASLANLLWQLIWPPMAIGFVLMVLFAIGHQFACSGVQTPFVRGSCN